MKTQTDALTRSPVRSRSGLRFGWAPVALTCIFATAACETSDVGQLCEDAPPTAIGDEPVGGEEPLVEMVRVRRDQACESFQCLQHNGLPAYCTEECKFIEAESTPACTTDGDCSGEAKCAQDGKCRLDDCPTGFACQTVQETGPLAEHQFCVRRTCQNNLDCGNLGVLECVEHACYDKCLKQGPNETCEVHAVVCDESKDFFGNGEVECSCANNAENFACGDDQLRCALPESVHVWPENSVVRQRFCLARDRVKQEPIPTE